MTALILHIDESTYMNVVAHTSAIGSWVIIPEDRQLLSATHGNLNDKELIYFK